LYPRTICVMLSQRKEVKINDHQEGYKEKGPDLQVPQFMLGSDDCHNVISVFRPDREAGGGGDMGTAFSPVCRKKSQDMDLMETGMNMKRMILITALLIALTAGLSATGYAAQSETAGYGNAQAGNNKGMEGQPAHMQRCAMMMRRAVMMKMMKKVMEIEKKILLAPAEGEKKEMIKELDLMMEKLDKMTSRMQMMMNETTGGATGGYPAVEHQHKKDDGAGKQ